MMKYTWQRNNLERLKIQNQLDQLDKERSTLEAKIKLLDT
jgi:cell division protein FtsB